MENINWYWSLRVSCDSTSWNYNNTTLKNLLCCCLVQVNKASYYHRILKMCLKMYTILNIEQNHIFSDSAILSTEKANNEHSWSILENIIWYWSLKGSCNSMSWNYTNATLKNLLCCCLVQGRKASKETIMTTCVLANLCAKVQF